MADRKNQGRTPETEGEYDTYCRGTAWSWTRNPRVVDSIPITGTYVCNPWQVALL